MNYKGKTNEKRERFSSFQILFIQNKPCFTSSGQSRAFRHLAKQMNWFDNKVPANK